MNLLKLSFAPAIALSLMTGSAHGQLVINMTYTDFQNNAPVDVNTILQGGGVSDAIAVMDHAAALWEDAFENSQSGLDWASSGVLTQTINVSWGPKSGNTLATGGTGWFGSGDNAFSSGSLTWDNDGTSSFFVDTSPTESSEWNTYVESDANFNGVDVNVQRFHYNAPNGTDARNNSDMLTIALHEIGHALGFLGSYPQYDQADLGNDNDIDIVDPTSPFVGAQIGIDGGHTDVTIASPFSSPTTYNPTVMASGLFTGTRYDLTEADIAIVAEYLDFNQGDVNFAPVPEPSSLALLGLGGLLLARRRRRD